MCGIAWWRPDNAGMDLERMSTGELLDAWRDATRAAELAERLSAAALRAADRADTDASTAHEIAVMAEAAAASAEKAAKAAREAAAKATESARALRAEVTGADETVASARGVEAAAGGRYHEAEEEARNKHVGDGR